MIYMTDRIFIDTNILIYAYLDNDVESILYKIIPCTSRRDVSLGRNGYTHQTASRRDEAKWRNRRFLLRMEKSEISAFILF
ncbi:MAG: hypothetical protein FWG98_13950 [Candidatus Cloacimonetes bacterium]|nr:hypothetical protein [Candidatus Cloacimonadota bacterium]